jgi:hypothetical protein
VRKRIAFNKGDVVGVFVIIEEGDSRKTPNGSVKTSWVCECKICGNETLVATSGLYRYKSCGCLQHKRDNKPIGSGRQTPVNTNVHVNTVISIYKSNANKRGIPFELSYSEFERLITSECVFCGSDRENVLIKKGYDNFSYTGIDRLDNAIGYTFANTVSCCRWCNRAKNSHSLEYFISQCRAVAETH